MNAPEDPAQGDPNAPVARALLRSLEQQRPSWDRAREDALWRRTQERMNAEQPQAPLRLQAVLGIAGLATAGALAFALWAPVETPGASGEAAALSTPRVAEARTSASISGGGATLTFDATDRLRLPSGALAERTSGGLIDVVTATADATHLRLQSGRVSNEVPSLRAGQRYEVETATALVSVRGTRFAVAVEAPDHTLVSVEHGKVEVAPKDWRVVTLVVPGEQRALMNCGPSVEAAERSTHPRCIAEAFAARAAASADPVERDTLLLKGALAASTTNAAEAVGWWRRARELSPAGIHAEEVAFRELEALGQAKQWARRAERAQAFVKDFAASPRVSTVRSWVVPPR